MGGAWEKKTEGWWGAAWERVKKKALKLNRPKWVRKHHQGGRQKTRSLHYLEKKNQKINKRWSKTKGNIANLA